MMKNRTVNILGTKYNIITRKYDEDTTFEKNDWVAYCEERAKNIIICDLSTYPCDEFKNKKTHIKSRNEILRHEIIHAYLNESGLSHNAYASQCWAKNEEMVDWLAIQLPKIFKTYKELSIID